MCLVEDCLSNYSLTSFRQTSSGRVDLVERFKDDSNYTQEKRKMNLNCGDLDSSSSEGFSVPSVH